MLLPKDTLAVDEGVGPVPLADNDGHELVGLSDCVVLNDTVPDTEPLVEADADALGPDIDTVCEAVAELLALAVRVFGHTNSHTATLPPAVGVMSFHCPSVRPVVAHAYFDVNISSAVSPLPP